MKLAEIKNNDYKCIKCGETRFMADEYFTYECSFNAETEDKFHINTNDYATDGFTNFICECGEPIEVPAEELTW